MEATKQEDSPEKSWFDSKAIKEFFNKGLEEFKKDLKETWSKIHNLKQANYQLGIEHFNRGNFYDARARFRILSWFSKDFPDVDYYRGRCHLEEGNFERAKTYFNNYAKSGDQKFAGEVKYCLKIANEQHDKITEVPTSIIAHNFDVLAPRYESIFIKDKQNLPQQTLFAALNQYVNEKGKPYGNNILDLGCGTGFMGKLCQKSKLSNAIVGVDISKKMLNFVKDLKFDDLNIYSKTHNVDIKSYFTHHAANMKFNIIIASCLLPYFTDLELFFKSCGEHILDNGVLALTYKSNAEKDYLFDSSFEEFSYKPEYIRKAATKNGWKVAANAEITFVDGDKGEYLILHK